MVAFAGMVLSFVACDDDEATPDGPTITAPLVTNVQVETSADVTFPVTVPGGYKSVEVTATGGTATKKSEPEAGAKSGNVVVTFVADAIVGAGTVTITVTDNNSKTQSQTAAINKTADPQKPMIDVFASSEGVGTVTWTADNIYVLRGFIYVNDGQTLTIEPGTVIKGQPGQGAGASALIVARGGKIIANGTPEKPIIFTALEDDVNVVGSDVAITERGLWGGLILLGNAYINHSNGQTNIEGIPASSTEARSLYGVGADPQQAGGKEWTLDNAHNAGELSYVSIRHGGTNIGAGNEINGLTMGGVGTGTKIHHVEVYGNDDDGFEWFGGTVNSSYLASIYNQDDAFDWDFGWRGENQFWLIAQEPGFDQSDRGIEADGAHGDNWTAETFTRPRVYNMTLIGQGNSGNTDNVMLFTEGCGGYIHNSIIRDFARGINPDNVGATGMTSRDRLANGDLVFSHNIFFNIGTSTTLEYVGSPDGATPLTALVEHLTNNNNEVGDPTVGVVDGKFKLLPSAGSLPLTKSRSPLPTGEVNGFTYQTADFIGAFGSTNWLKGWTAADAYGLLAD